MEYRIQGFLARKEIAKLNHRDFEYSGSLQAQAPYEEDLGLKHSS